mgnify:CR=1 FL=1
MNNNFIRLAGDTQHWDDEITRRVAAGEDLCRLQEEQSARGYLPYRLVLSMYGWTIRYASGLQGFGLVYSSRSFNPADALAEGQRIVARNPRNYELIVSKREIENCEADGHDCSALRALERPQEAA